MSKELTPLDAFKRIKNHCENDFIRNMLYGYEKELKIVKTALKRNIELEKANIKLMEENTNLRERLFDFYSDVEKKLKAFENLSKDYEKVMKELSKEIEKNRALEIIKEKRVDIDLLIRCFNAYCIDSARQEYNQWTHTETLTHEECVLLKKVLL